METRILAPSFQSVEFIDPDLQKPKIQSGGPSDSNILNRYFNSLTNDVLNINTRLNELALRSNRVADICSTSGTGLTSTIAGLVSSVDAINTTTQVYIDLFSSWGVDVTSTALQNKIYGQFTLNETSSKNLLVNTDINNDLYLLSDITVSYTLSASTSIPAPETFYKDIESLYMLTRNQTWMVDTTAQNYIWVKIQAPMNYLSLYPNCLEVWPVPMNISDLYRVYTKAAGAATTGTFDAVDLSYLPFYDLGTSSAKTVGPFRLFLENTPLTEILMCFKLNGLSNFGINRLTLSHKEYEAASSITIKDPFSRSITGSPTLKGKNPVSLSQLNVVPVGPQYQITLTTNNSAITPVISGFIIPV